jgi:hypothetical protein
MLFCELLLNFMEYFTRDILSGISKQVYFAMYCDTYFVVFRYMKTNSYLIASYDTLKEKQVVIYVYLKLIDILL